VREGRREERRERKDEDQIFYSFTLPSLPPSLLSSLHSCPGPAGAACRRYHPPEPSRGGYVVGKGGREGGRERERRTREGHHTQHAHTHSIPPPSPLPLQKINRGPVPPSPARLRPDRPPRNRLPSLRPAAGSSRRSSNSSRSSSCSSRDD
jgi:hypothetical protein